MAAPLVVLRGGSPIQREPAILAALGRATRWLNSPRLPAADLAGKVVLVNFCTYSCINWTRQLPYIRAWAQKYKGRLAVVGVHTPEFGFERKVDNVQRAIERLRIEYPIAIDNDYLVWRGFNNQSWPALYFIDARGRLRNQHDGEGAYDVLEGSIQQLLTDAGAPAQSGGVAGVKAVGVEAAADWDNLRSPENYLGYDRTQNFGSPAGIDRDRRRAYLFPAEFRLNEWAVAGDWTAGHEAIVLNRAGGRIVTRFHARDVHLVMGPARRETPVRFRVSIDGQPPGANRGVDVDDRGVGTAVDQRLYQLIRQSRPIVDRQFEIEFLDAGIEAFSFTFG
jgi:thiol-disulfide isomerase/thioredoxin